ncbi:DUF3090 family protein [Ktedonobacteria bacterium brp13]|nr:DUF3090 family protein [Ktedonobacteria bacterium brp13]
MSVDLGLVPTLGADAVGQPGQRRFRLFARSEQESAVMWMEKEQLAGLSEVLDRALALITEGQVLRVEARAEEAAGGSGMPSDFPSYPTHDIQAGQMRLNYDESAGTFSLSVVPIEALLEEEGSEGDEEEPQIAMRYEEAITFAFTQQQAHELSQSIQHILTAGRPVCPLCHMPLDGGPHACVKQNGHRDITQIEDAGESE